MFSKTGRVWPQHADYEQQCGHLCQGRQRAADLHSKHFSQILLLLKWVISLSFADAQGQKVHYSQHNNLHLKFEHFVHLLHCLHKVKVRHKVQKSLSSWLVSQHPFALYSNCHLYEDCALVGLDQ